MPSIINATTTGGVVVSGDNSGSLQLATNNGTTAVTVTTSQKVGIGVSSPTYLLEVNGNPNFNSVGGVYLTCGTYDAIKNPSGSILAFGGVTASQWDTTALYTGGTERMRIDSSGVLLVNDTSPLIANSLDRVQVGCSVPSGGNQYGEMIGGNAQSYTVYAMRFVNTYTPAVVGTITIGSSSTAYNTSSDYRLKQNITPMTGALATVSTLKPVTYKWKLDGKDGQGFIAHELAEVMPEAVTGEKDAVDEENKPVYQGVDTSFLVATLTAAIQELNAKVEAQAVRIAELEGAK